MKKLFYLIFVLSIITETSGLLNIKAASMNSVTPRTAVQEVYNHFKSDSNPEIHFQGPDEPNPDFIYSPNNAKDEGNIWWIAHDNSNILIEKAPQVKGYITPFSVQDSPNGTRTFSPKLENFVNEVDRILVQQGFKRDEKNSSKNINDQQFYDYVQAYTKDNMVCTLRVDPDNYIYKETSKSTTQFDLECSDQFVKYYHEQHDLLKTIPNTEHSTVNVRKKVGDFIEVSIHLRRTGHYAILKKVNGGYTIIYEGLDYPPCNVMTQNNVPEKIYEKCFDSNGILQTAI